MKHYVGIVKIEHRYIGGIDVEIRTKFSYNKKDIKKWIKKLYPRNDAIIIKSSKELKEFFEVFEDVTPIKKRKTKKGKKKLTKSRID